LGSQQLSIHIKTLLDDLKDFQGLLPENRFLSRKISPEKSLQKNLSIFCLENQSCDRRYMFLTKKNLVQIRFVTLVFRALSPLRSLARCQILYLPIMPWTTIRAYMVHTTRSMMMLCVSSVQWAERDKIGGVRKDKLFWCSNAA